jgi:tetratricopeptide (TPR) repeat protein
MADSEESLPLASTQTTESKEGQDSSTKPTAYPELDDLLERLDLTKDEKETSTPETEKVQLDSFEPIPIEPEILEPDLLDDLVDEEALKEEETKLAEEDFVARLEKAKAYKQEGNDEFGKMNYRESILIYTKGLLICPLRDKEFRSILYANRSAAKIKMGRNELAIDDCTKSLEYNPEYVRVLLRRAKLYEEAEKLEEALADYQKVYELDPSVREAWNAMQRLPGEIHEKNEKLKAEMMGKLKELGNMILKPFGLSTDNFKLQQDPNSGGYSINFNK